MVKMFPKERSKKGLQVEVLFRKRFSHNFWQKYFSMQANKGTH